MLRMEQTFSEEFKKTFLLLFTRELIIHSAKGDVLKLQKIIETAERRRMVPLVPGQRPLLRREGIEPRKAGISVRTIPLKKKPLVKQLASQFPPRSSLFIPEQKLPAHLEYLKPIPVPGVEIDLGKINPLIKDPAVRIIEGNPDERVIVTGTMGTKMTDIILNKEDIDRIINKFSQLSKIPTDEGVYRVAVGNLILAAILSEVISSRFIIRKMTYPPREQYPAAEQKQSKQPKLITPSVNPIIK
jgi:hypothetical protein